MSDENKRDYPPGVPNRRRRPDAERDLGPALIGALAGGAITEHLGGALVGGIIGHALTPPGPLPLQEALRQALAEKGATLSNFYRLGSHGAKVLFLYKGGYWTIQSRAERAPGWTRAALDDWLYGDLVDVQLKNKLQEIDRGGAS